MHRADRNDHELHAIVDHELDDDALRAALGRLLDDPDAAARCAAYHAQLEALTALRDGLTLSLPAPALVELEEELRATAQRQEQMRLTLAVGGAMAVMALIGYASWPGSASRAGRGTPG
jgi:anti-sigma factor RsiW